MLEQEYCEERKRKAMEKSVYDFGAIGDGIHDNYEAFQAALDSGVSDILIPQGIYNISGTLKIHSNTRIIADRGAKIVMKSATRRHRNDFLICNSDRENGNSNIEICGGIWDGNNTAPENKKPELFDRNGYSGVVISLVNVKNLILKDMVLSNSVTFYIRLCKVENFAIENIDFISDQFGENQDGLHFGGNVRHGKVKNIRALSYGQTNDDMIALNADDSIERVENLDLCRDTIEDIEFENIFAENCHTIIRMLSVTAEIKNIRFKNVYGGFRCNAVNADAARYCRTPLFQEEDYPAGVGNIHDISFENFTCYPIFQVMENVDGIKVVPETALQLEAQMDQFSITGFHYCCNEEDSNCCPAISIKNIRNEEVHVDNQIINILEKEDVIKVQTFENLRIQAI